MSRIIALGECMVEMAPLDAPSTYRMNFAGDTMNTAWYLRRLLPATHSVDYYTVIGADAVSDQMLDFLRASGLGTDHIARRPDLTVGLYMIQLSEGERSFSYWRSQSAARTLGQDATALRAALEGAEIAYFSGITVAILPADDRQRLFDVLAAFRAQGGQVVFDPNLRPKLWASPREMTEAITRAAAVSTTVMPSHEDEAAWFNDDDVTATAARYAAGGAQTVIVKNGADRMLAQVGKDLSWHTPEVVTQVVDTTAAGDSFNAGYLAASLDGQTVADAIRSGAQLAARVIQSRGALVEL